MDGSHFIVGGMTAIAFAWLVWAEIRSRRNTAALEQNPIPTGVSEPPRPAEKKEREGR